MAALNIEPQPRLPELFRASGILPPLMLFDVGASEGLAKHFSIFGKDLRAVGFDPLLTEVERLNREETNPNVKFEAAFIGCDQYDARLPSAFRQSRILSKDNSSFHRTSSTRALAAMNMNYSQIVHNRGDVVRYADARYSLDEYVNRNEIADADFLKIDTDGHDFEVLLGAERMLRDCRVVGAEIEVLFHGIEHPQANVFHNIDHFMRQAGFTLFDLEVWRYSRGALPARFNNNFPSQTVSGSIQWGDALYFRDLADPEYAAMHDFPLDRDKLVKLACLFELYSLPDCAAELVLRAKQEQQYDLPYEDILNALTPGEEAYDAYVARFDQNPKAFYTF